MISLFLLVVQVPVAPDGHPHLWAPPISCVARLLPLQPPLMGHLVPQAINVWMGAAQEGEELQLLFGVFKLNNVLALHSLPFTFVL